MPLLEVIGCFGGSIPARSLSPSSNDRLADSSLRSVLVEGQPKTIGLMPPGLKSSPTLSDLKSLLGQPQQGKICLFVSHLSPVSLLPCFLRVQRPQRPGREASC